MEEKRIRVGTGVHEREIAYIRRPGKTPGLFWLGGFHSSMDGSKASSVARWSAARAP